MAARKVLVAEDESLVAMVLRMKLVVWGYEVVALERTGAGAIAAFDAAGPDLALLDIYLADDVTGIEVARHIAERSSVPVVFLTASQDRETRELAASLQPAAIVAKPYSDAILREVLQGTAET